MQLTRGTLEWYELLSRALVWAAGIVLLLSVVGAVVITGSDGALPFLAEAERQGRGVLALASLGGGVTSAAILAGVGAILRLMVVERMSTLPDEPERDGPDSPPAKPEPKRRTRSTTKREKPESGSEE